MYVKLKLCPITWKVIRIIILYNSGQRDFREQYE